MDLFEVADKLRSFGMALRGWDMKSRVRRPWARCLLFRVCAELNNLASSWLYAALD